MSRIKIGLYFLFGLLLIFFYVNAEECTTETYEISVTGECGGGALTIAEVNCVQWDKNGVGYCKITGSKVQSCLKTKYNGIADKVLIRSWIGTEGARVGWSECIYNPLQNGICTGFLAEEWTASGIFSYNLNQGKSVSVVGDSTAYKNECGGIVNNVFVDECKLTVYMKRCCPSGYRLKYDVTTESYYCDPITPPCSDYTLQETCPTDRCCWANGACYDKNSPECQSCTAITDQQTCEANSACCWNNGACYDISSGNCPCSDTDNGNNPYVKGTATDAFQSLTDYCVSDTRLNEYYCSGSSVASEVWNCQSCVNGACECTGKQVGEPCTSSEECCSGFCYGTSPGEYTCQSTCAGLPNYYAPDSQACCYGLGFGGTCNGPPEGACDSYTNYFDCFTNNCKWCGPQDADCSPNTCGDGIDNDKDGLTDREDSACWTGGYVNVGEYNPSRSECKRNYCYSQEECPYCCSGYQCSLQPCQGCQDSTPDNNPESCNYIGSCSGRNSCPGATVIVNMTSGNVIRGCLSNDRTGTWNGKWYLLKGALGEPVNISFYSTVCGKAELRVFAISNCNKLWSNPCNSPWCYQLAELTHGKVRITYDPYFSQYPQDFAFKQYNPETGFEELVIREMPYGGITMLVTTGCGNACPYCIRVNSKTICG